MDGPTAQDWRLDWPEWQAPALSSFAQRCGRRFSACLVEATVGAPVDVRRKRERATGVKDEVGRTCLVSAARCSFSKGLPNLTVSGWLYSAARHLSVT